MTQGQRSATAIGNELINGRRNIDVAESDWFAALADFDLDGLYVCDGHMTTASWLVDRCGMSRTTAKDKLRVAHQLRRRPVLPRGARRRPAVVLQVADNHTDHRVR